MMIHKELLTHDGVAYNDDKAGKWLDLGFNGDFDVKNHAWNMVFIALPKGTYAAAVTVYARTEAIPAWSKTTYSANALVKYKGCIWKAKAQIGTAKDFDEADWAKQDLAQVAALLDTATDTDVYGNRKDIGSFAISAADAAKGGVFGIPMPKGLGRYFTLNVTSGAGSNLVTAGITDQVDTDCNPGVDWTYYKAETAEVNQPGRIETAAAKLSEGPQADAIAAHAALTEGVHGLT